MTTTEFSKLTNAHDIFTKLGVHEDKVIESELDKAFYSTFDAVKISAKPNEYEAILYHKHHNVGWVKSSSLKHLLFKIVAASYDKSIVKNMLETGYYSSIYPSPKVLEELESMPLEQIIGITLNELNGWENMIIDDTGYWYDIRKLSGKAFILKGEQRGYTRTPIYGSDDSISKTLKMTLKLYNVGSITMKK